PIVLERETVRLFVEPAQAHAPPFCGGMATNFASYSIYSCFAQRGRLIMQLRTCSCLRPGESYEAGPTTCVAHPKVIKAIRKQISANSVLSAADARVATLAGLLDIPAVGKTGFNDGVIYPPTDTAGPAMVAAARRRPAAARFSLAPPSGKTTLNCLVLL